MVLYKVLSRSLDRRRTRYISRCMVYMPFYKLSRMLNASIGPMVWLVFLYNNEIMGDCESYFVLCLIGTAAFPIVVFLRTPMVINTI